ncbi:hypothetical protein RIF29_10380 [Crotalaria pallida]|uniref:Uncharacterized protein n=1 Tax=Crotalaria pallida TaxID=3830 RepID=A0AAN9IIC9_CROPI
MQCTLGTILMSTWATSNLSTLHSLVHLLNLCSLNRLKPPHFKSPSLISTILNSNAIESMKSHYCYAFGSDVSAFWLKLRNRRWVAGNRELEEGRSAGNYGVEEMRGMMGRDLFDDTVVNFITTRALEPWVAVSGGCEWELRGAVVDGCGCGCGGGRLVTDCSLSKLGREMEDINLTLIRK